MKHFLRNGSLWLLLAAIGSVFLMNLFSFPAHDELAYAFGGQSTPSVGAVDRIAGVGDIVRQQLTDYCTPGMNGRVLLHGIVAVFAGFRLYLLFDVLNTAVFLLLVIGILREGGVAWRDPKRLLFGFTVVWWFIWYAVTCSMNAAFAVNYLWTACATCFILNLWGRLSRSHGWALPLFFLYGWSQELFVLPMIAALAAQGILRAVITRRLVFNRCKLAAWLLMCAGAGFLCLGPAAQGRATDSLVRPISVFLRELICLNLNFVFLVFPALLLAAVLWILFQKRRTCIQELFLDSPWWLYLCFAYGLYCAVNYNAVRLTMPTVLAALVCVIRERRVLYAALPALVRFKNAFVCGALLWIAVAAGHQIVYGLELQHTLRRYTADEQGISTYTFHTSPLWFYSAHQAFYELWHWTLFRLEYGKPVSPTIIPESLYNTLYLNPPAFFRAATELDGSGLLILPSAPKVVVKPGDASLTPHQKALLARHWEYLNPPKRGWKRLIPGRFQSIFPDREAVAFPQNPFTLTAKDGSVFTLYARPVAP